jgi:hypothetical protein
MVLLDVSLAVTSAYLCDSFSVTRRVQTVNNFGLASATPSTITPVYGVVAPSNENDLQRHPELEINSKAITVITSFALRSESELADTEFLPDIVVWNNDNFLVRTLDDWSQYAAGFTLCICTSIDLVDQPPTTEPYPFLAE